MSLIEDETYQAISGTSAWKSPGPDGMPVGFFQKFWPIIKEEVISVISDLFFG